MKQQVIPKETAIALVTSGGKITDIVKKKSEKTDKKKKEVTNEKS